MRPNTAQSQTDQTPRKVKLTKKLIAERAERAERVRKVNERTVANGLTRPARAPEKRAALEQTGGLGPFVEGKAPRPTERPARRA